MEDRYILLALFLALAIFAGFLWTRKISAQSGKRERENKGTIPETGGAPSNPSLNASVRWPIRAHRTVNDVDWLRTRRDLPGLVRMLHYADPVHPVEAASVRWAAAGALVGLDDPRAIDPLILALQDEHSSVRAAAARGLGQLGSPLRPMGKTGAGKQARSRILSALFPLVERDPANEARWAAAEALYRVGGSNILRPLIALFRQRSAGRPETLANQRWLVHWALSNRLDGLLIDVYPWFSPAARREIVEALRSSLTPRILTRLSLARDSEDPDLEELAEQVLGT